MPPSAPSIALLGMGKMGTAMALRLRQHGVGVSIWNRTRSLADAVKSHDMPGTCSVGESVNATLDAAAADATVIITLSDTAAVQGVLERIGDKLRGRTVLNLTSGSPDDGRQIAAMLAAPALGVKAYIDGAYCGPPAKVRAGSGVLFLSSEAPHEVERLRSTLGLLGEVAFASGPVGASRALDYAVVDLALTGYASFLANIEMLEQERVDHAQLHEHVAKRLATLPGALKGLHARCTGERTDSAYAMEPSVTLATVRAWWASRLPYLHARAIPDDFPALLADLAARASGGVGGPHAQADVSRMQEVMRSPRAAMDGAAGAKRQRVGLGSVLSADAAFGADFRVVNVFARSTYAGNPTCVVFPPTGMDDTWMSKVAVETAQPTTSFVDIDAMTFRTFSPSGTELPILSGHSSLGVVAATMERLGERRPSPPPDALKFGSKYGEVQMARDGAFFELRLPIGSGASIAKTDAEPLRRALGVPDAAAVLNHGSVLGGKFLFCELAPAAFAALAPDVAAIRAMPDLVGVFVTAAGMPAAHGACTDRDHVDFSVRNFVPSLGIDEDVATGSIQAFLNPYWRARLSKPPDAPLYAWQNSRRGGLVRSRMGNGDDAHVLVAGECALSLRGVAPL